MSNTIDRDILFKDIEESMRNNPHKNAEVKLNHFNEHLHFMKIVHVQPTIDTMKHGQWIDEGTYITTAYGSLKVYQCSNCKNDIVIDDFDSYCPACGTKMDL